MEISINLCKEKEKIERGTSSPTNAKGQSIALAAILFTMVPPFRKIRWPAELPQKRLRFSDSSFSQLTASSPSSYIILVNNTKNCLENTFWTHESLVGFLLRDHKNETFSYNHHFHYNFWVIFKKFLSAAQ